MLGASAWGGTNVVGADLAAEDVVGSAHFWICIGLAERGFVRRWAVLEGDGGVDAMAFEVLSKLSGLRRR